MSNMLWLEDIGSIRRDNDQQCTWMAPSILVFDEINTCITSPIFSLEGRKWRIAKMENNIYLWSADHNLPKHAYKVTLSIEGKEGEGDAWHCYGETYLDYGFGHEFNYHSIPSLANVRHGEATMFIKVEKIKKKPSDEKSLSSETTNENDSSSNIEDEEQPKEIKLKGLDRLVQNFKDLLIDGQNSDATLKAGDREFPVHKLILKARSPVLATMIELESKDKTGDVVDIPDCTAESFEVFLLYLYTGSAETISSDNVSDLYSAADKYRVDDLKEDCVQFMKDNMTVENIVDVVVLALRHSETRLMKDAMHFFGQNIREIIKTAKWKAYMQENSAHANELFIKALNA